MKRRRKISSWVILASAAVITAGVALYSLPSVMYLRQEHTAPGLPPFPVTVDPRQKIIVEDPTVESMFSQGGSLFAAAVLRVGDALDLLASAIAASYLYRTLSPADDRFVVIDPGNRKEEVAAAFANTLEWDAGTKTVFLESETNTPPIPEGHFSPGMYAIGPRATERDVRAAIRERFERQILSRYATSTAQVIPLFQALTIASMIERETKDRDEMRLISGVIWNRIFAGMKLQIDATVQYAKANVRNGWWPPLRSRDKFIDSPYNTYLNTGLPPTPISNPSVAAVLAALNPKKTPCLFYFHDQLGAFHCTETYEEHVALLKKYFGRGK